MDSDHIVQTYGHIKEFGRDFYIRRPAPQGEVKVRGRDPWEDYDKSWRRTFHASNRHWRQRAILSEGLLLLEIRDRARDLANGVDGVSIFDGVEIVYALCKGGYIKIEREINNEQVFCNGRWVSKHYALNTETKKESKKCQQSC